MKKIALVTLALSCLTNVAHATDVDSTAKVAARSGALSKSSNDGNSQNITFTSPAEQTINQQGTQTIRNTPSMAGPNLTSSNDTCMGSASGAVSAPGIGLSLGKTYTDPGCVMLKNSRELWNMGMKAAAMALMCTDTNNREALEITGYECPQTTKARSGNLAVQRTAQPPQEQYTDPIVRARLDLPPLSN